HHKPRSGPTRETTTGRSEDKPLEVDELPLIIARPRASAKGHLGAAGQKPDWKRERGRHPPRESRSPDRLRHLHTLF
ncbi:MAG TPA: hypothetical protein VGQ16_06100, partial [Vicinamibacterales bacterium]|nr:hypothetical protein [Vicinamibacterales bacterium]